jgi:myosin heavy subunit
VLIAVNPFKGVPALYTDAVLRHYKARRSGEHQEGFEPHIFLTADKVTSCLCAQVSCTAHVL